MHGYLEPNNQRISYLMDCMPTLKTKKEVLTVGTGTAELDYHLSQAGYKVWSTDTDGDKWYSESPHQHISHLDIYKSDILDLDSFPIKSCETVICSEVLEHITDYKTAFKNLLMLTDRRLIVTVPFGYSYDVPAWQRPSPECHVNYWHDEKKHYWTRGQSIRDSPSGSYEQTVYPIGEFEIMAHPYLTTITKIVSKDEDWLNNTRSFVIIVDKAQKSSLNIKEATEDSFYKLQISEEDRFEQVKVSRMTIKKQAPKPPWLLDLKGD